MTRPVSLALFSDRRSWLRRWPRVKKMLRDRFLRRRAWAIRLEDDMVLCRILGRFKLFADPRDRSISPYLMMDGFWEPRTTETIVDLTRRGMVAIDAGANLGYFTVLMAALCDAHGRVLSFEPNPATARRLRETVLINGFAGRVDVHPDVLGASDGEEVTLLLSDDHPGGTQVTALTSDGGAAFLKARTRRLDGVPGALDAAIVKIDTEGMEEAIWRGMTAMIAGDALRYVIVEFTPSSYADGPGMLDEAEAAGFSIWRIDDQHGLRPIGRAEIFDGTELRMLLFRR